MSAPKRNMRTAAPSRLAKVHKNIYIYENSARRNHLLILTWLLFQLIKLQTEKKGMKRPREIENIVENVGGLVSKIGDSLRPADQAAK